MRLSQRLGLERRLAAAEAVVSKRVLSRVVELLADEWQAGDWTRRQQIESVMARLTTGEIEGLATDPVGAVLRELAKTAPAVAARIAAAVGIQLGARTAAIPSEKKR